MEKKELFALLSQMTLAEKIGQLVQLTPNFFAEVAAEGEITGPLAELGITKEELYTLGSVLGTHTKEEVYALQKNYLAHSRLKIPLVFMADVIHGYETIFPIPLALGASFDPAVAEEVASLSGAEASAAGVHVTFSPMVDLVRDPRWGRVLESTGEDSYLNSLMATAFVKGYQGTAGELATNFRKIAACVKHFAGYGAAEGGRDYNTVDLSDWNLYQNYLPAFQAAVTAGVKLVMTSFNVLKGIPSTANKWLLQDVLRQDLGFEGVVISDWGAVRELVTHRVAEDLSAAAQRAFTAGCTMDMMSSAYIKYLGDLVATGVVAETDIDAAVLQVLTLKNDLGLFADPYRGLTTAGALGVEEEVLRKASRQAAAKSMVLLKNDEDILPLTAGQKVAVVGPFAASQDILGAWSWIGQKAAAVSLAAGLQATDLAVTVVPTVDRLAYTPKEIDAMLAAAAASDVVVVALGESTSESGEATSKGQPSLPATQVALLQKIAAVNEKVVTVLFNGRPLLLADILPATQGLVEAFFPGSEGGHALADILTGKVAPSAKLPMSYPATLGQIPLHYDELSTGRPLTEDYAGGGYVSFYLDQPNAPLFPFGYGLTYGQLEVVDVTFPATMSHQLPVTVTLHNPGAKAVTETLQVYLEDLVGEVALPKRSLKHLQKVTVAPGTSEKIELTLTKDDLAYVHADLTTAADPGDFKLYVGFDSQCPAFGTFRLVEG